MTEERPTPFALENLSTKVARHVIKLFFYKNDVQNGPVALVKPVVRAVRLPERAHKSHSL